MPLQIESAELDRMAQELSELTGEPVEAAVGKAIREQLKKEKELCRLFADIKEIQDRYARLPVLDHRSDDEIIGYDEHGVPA